MLKRLMFDSILFILVIIIFIISLFTPKERKRSK